MADLFTRLAERALGIAPTLRPMATSVFAPETGVVTDTAAATVDSRVVASKATILPEESPRPDQAEFPAEFAQTRANDSHPAPVEESVKGSRTTIQSASRTQTAAHEFNHPLVAKHEPEVRRPAPHREPSAPALQADAAPSAPASKPLDVGSEYDAQSIPKRSIKSTDVVSRDIRDKPVDVAMDTAAPPAPLHPAGFDLREPPASHSPVIRITIGRVEVKAVQPATAPAPPRSPARAPSLTLADYLKQRKGGRR